ncbi:MULTISPECIES: glycosyltransferase family 4 protein [unclassified Achromobacter]|uniref:glycosyltransferase family 4 protein n=1 Tax=unclassified Achromobacter TaxID=2626865 RepID=UPI000B5154E6|nr:MULTISPECIES: glycosyltransferase family 4 protein [unclassified Achromobacter]OWT72744.1 glycosyltransferase WbuB [Achromobacter sp. HZ34]OWT73963.1 glycosyltransferase WbuB [Achromobacter sp. HZ28]
MRWLTQPWLGLSRMLTTGAIQRQLDRPAAATPYAPDSGSLLYVAASALPYHMSGYVTRTHEVMCALRSARPNVHVMTRPGYPWDRRDRLGETEGPASEVETTQVENITYTHLRAPSNLRPVLQYAVQAAQAVAQVAQQHRVAVIHAASNHVNALPALLAARQLGVPFQYEMRGLWELTRSARRPRYEETQGFRQGLQLEGLVASHADRLFVISEQLRCYAQAHWPIHAERMALLPNCVDPARFPPADPLDVEPDTIGYAGSLISYEGLDTLIEAVGRLWRAGRRVTVTLIGHGEAEADLRAQVARAGLTDLVLFMGRMPPAEARAYLARCALVCIPRKPFDVCRIVPPIKLVEAMALGRPVVAADLPVLRDEFGERPAGWFFKAGDAADLAKTLGRALSDRAALERTGARARQYAVAHRSWSAYVQDILPGM